MYVEKLAAADESAWKDTLEPMGNTSDIPKLFRHAGKVPPSLYTLHSCSVLLCCAVLAQIKPRTFF